jgi:hypothetical protein
MDNVQNCDTSNYKWTYSRGLTHNVCCWQNAGPSTAKPSFLPTYYVLCRTMKATLSLDHAYRDVEVRLEIMYEWQDSRSCLFYLQEGRLGTISVWGWVTSKSHLEAMTNEMRPDPFTILKRDVKNLKNKSADFVRSGVALRRQTV